MSRNLFYPIQKEIDDLENTFFKLVRDYEPLVYGRVEKQPSMTVDVINKDSEYIYNFTIPGVDKDNIKVTIDDNILTVKGERKFEKDLKKDDYEVVESFYGVFERSLSLPEDADVDNIEAKYENGVLKLTIPKNQEKKSAKQIEIK